MQQIRIEHRGAVALVTLARPPANAMDIALTDEIADVFDRLGKDGQTRAVVLTGSGKAFCAGLDLKQVPGFGDADQRALLRALNRAFLAVYDCPVPVIAALNGHTIAGGLVLALCCDWRIAARVPMLVGVTEVRVGIPYPLAGIEVVRAELSPPVAREFVLFGQNVDAEAALRDRVVDALVEPAELEAAALKKATEMAALPLEGFAKIKRQLRAQALERMRAVVSGEDPYAGNWLSDETKAAAAAILAGGRG